ncbi:ferredoxin [Rhodococcus sp. OK302]|uniref:ferredoxin n=1 Tax=Rhodococcus sp. OK302 TaxID=1882769 RepID=UPI000B93F295|nr:ferredoxin [Rhodococcus sp. OK302]OYD71123.1 ferredoxin [Rhodococcus sp. OK302]
MRIAVDVNVCEQHGQCVFAAPAVFEIDGEGALQYQAEVAEDQRASVASAVNACPMQAITVID